MPEKQTFEIPQQLRELAEKNIEQALDLRAAHGCHDTGNECVVVGSLRGHDLRV
jgi:hypothetical protein